jgi:hypothetical protein
MSKMKGTSEEARSINGCLDHLKSKILNVEKTLIKKDIPVNLETFKMSYWELKNGSVC